MEEDGERKKEADSDVNPAGPGPETFASRIVKKVARQNENSEEP